MKYMCGSVSVRDLLGICSHSSRGMMVKGLMGQLDSSSRAVRKQSGAWALPRLCSASPRPLHASWARLWDWTASRNTFSPKPTRPIRTNKFPCKQRRDRYSNQCVYVMSMCVNVFAETLLNQHDLSLWSFNHTIRHNQIGSHTFTHAKTFWSFILTDLAITSDLLILFIYTSLTFLFSLIHHGTVNILVWISLFYTNNTATDKDWSLMSLMTHCGSRVYHVHHKCSGGRVRPDLVSPTWAKSKQTFKGCVYNPGHVLLTP